MKVKDEERKAEIGKEIRKIYKNEENKIVVKLEKSIGELIMKMKQCEEVLVTEVLQSQMPSFARGKKKKDFIIIKNFHIGKE